MKLFITITLTLTLLILIVAADVGARTIQSTRPQLKSQLEAEIIPNGQLPLENNFRAFPRTLQLPSEHHRRPFRPNEPIEIVFPDNSILNQPSHNFRPPPFSSQGQISSVEKAPERNWFSFIHSPAPPKPSKQTSSNSISQQILQPPKQNLPVQESNSFWSGFLTRFPVFSGQQQEVDTAAGTENGYNYPKPDKPFPDSSEFQSVEPLTTSVPAPEIITAPTDVEVEPEKFVSKPVKSPRPTFIHGIIFLHEGNSSIGGNDKLVIYRVPSGFN